MKKSSRIIIDIISILVAVMGLLNILSAWLVHVPYRIQLLRPYLPMEVTRGGRMLTVISGLALLFLSFSISGRKKRAWELTCAVLFVSIAANIIKGLDYEESIGAFILLMALLPMRKFFRAKSDTPSALNGIKILLSAAAGALFYGILGIYFFAPQLSFDFSLGSAALEVLKQFFEIGHSNLRAANTRAIWFVDSINIVGVLSLSYAFLNFLRPVIYREVVTVNEKKRAAEILNKYGKSSIARFTLFDDKSYFFSKSKGAYVAYKNIGNIAVALGDPVGPDGDIKPAVEEFGQFCADNDWRPVFYQVLNDYVDIYSGCGFKALQIGEEGAVDLKKFSLDGNQNRHRRYVVNKFTKLGYNARLYDVPIEDGLIKQLKEISGEWLSSHHGAELTFSLGRLDPDYIKTTPVMTVENKENKIFAFVNIINNYTKNEMTIDLMRHRQKIENSLMDFLLIQLAQYAKEKEYDSFSLGFSPLSGVGISADATIVERALKFVYTKFNRFYSFKGLRNFKDKFHPVWKPRYLIYPNDIILPRVALALIKAHSRGGILGYIK